MDFVLNWTVFVTEPVGSVGCEILMPMVMKSSVFWDITPCRSLKVNRRSGEHVASVLSVVESAKQETSMKQIANRALITACLACPLTLKETVCAPKASVDIQHTPRFYIREGRTLLCVYFELLNII
jgi:hypothetical protein